MKLETIKTVVTKKWEKIYVAATIGTATMLTTQSAYAADSLGCTKNSWEVPAPLVTLKNLINDPVQWIQIASAILLPFLLIMIFLKFKGAKGRQEKIEEAYKMLYWTVGIDIAIFSVTWAGGFLLGKIC